MKFTPEQIKERRMHRLAQLIFDHWEEGNGMDTRFFEVPLIHDSLVEKGRSAKGESYREHIVPRALIRDECLKMYDRGETVEEVRDQLVAHLWIARISPEEAEVLNRTHKATMPDGWVFGMDDPLARLKLAKIELAEQRE
jgi:hypothetical protein